MSSCQTPRGLNIFDASRACPHIDALFGRHAFMYNVETISIMSTTLRPYFIAMLVLVWAFDIWQQGLLQTNGSARHWRFYGAVIGMTCALVAKNQWTLATAFTAFALTWSRLPDTQLDATSSLPSFDKFIKSLADASRPDQTPQPSLDPTAAQTPTDPAASDDNPDAPTCIVCWSADDLPKVLPCAHLICPDCLTNLAAGTQNHCPLCRLPLFTRSNARAITTYRALASIWNADIAVRILGLVLHLYKREGWSRGIVFDATWVVWQSAYALWTRKMIVESGGGEWWRTPSFSRLDGGTLWRQPLAGFVLMGLTLAMKMHEVLGLDEKTVFTQID